jgi:hypothetical protein
VWSESLPASGMRVGDVSERVVMCRMKVLERDAGSRCCWWITIVNVRVVPARK